MFYLYSMHGPVLMKMAYTFSCVTRLGMRKQLQVTKLLYYLMLVAEPKRKVRVLVLTFLHDRWYVSWLVLTVSGGACNVSSIQYTARIVSPAVSSQYTPVCRVWSVLSLRRATPMHH